MLEKFPNLDFWGTWYQTVNTEQVLWYQPTRVGGENTVGPGRALWCCTMVLWRGYASLFEMKLILNRNNNNKNNVQQ